jgi:hypothetical protein
MRVGFHRAYAALQQPLIGVYILHKIVGHIELGVLAVKPAGRWTERGRIAAVIVKG